MKKLHKISVIFAAIFCINGAQALAKTEGSYIGVNVADHTAKHSLKASSGFIGNDAEDNSQESSNGVGLEFKNAYNFGGFFVAPGVFYDRIGNEAISVVFDVINLKNRYGVKVDLGYDFNEQFSSYLTAGYAGVSYNARVNRIVNSTLVRLSSSGREFAPIYGLGFLFGLSENVKFNVEANYQSFDIPLSNAVGYDNSETELASVKFGVLFNF